MGELLSGGNDCCITEAGAAEKKGELLKGIEGTGMVSRGETGCEPG